MNREEVNERLRNSFNSILNHKPTGKELARRKEIEEIARKEKEDYEKKKKDFYDNPLHWDNNKRRRHQYYHGNKLINLSIIYKWKEIYYGF